MVNGNYVLYGDRPSSESEIVDDHVHSRSNDRKNKRKANRTANELQHSLNLAQLDNETDSVKYEKKIKEPRLLRYVPTSEVEENFVTEKFETYDLKPTEERPRRYAFTKKAKNPADGSVNYAYSRSSSSCSSPNGNLPTISEHGEQYGTYRVRAMPSPTVNDLIAGYDTKLDKYFAKPRDVKPFSAKVGYNGSHPDSLYRVAADSGAGANKVTRVLRVLRWPVALVAVCIALAVFVYFLMPDNLESRVGDNGTYWEPVVAGHRPHFEGTRDQHNRPENHDHGMKTSEIDFYAAENDKTDRTTIVDTTPATIPKRTLPIPPVFPTHLTPEVQYGNEKADTDSLRTPKLLENADNVSSTVKPHITQKPEKPLALYFEDGSGATSTTTEVITRAETANDFTNIEHKQITKTVEEPPQKLHPMAHKENVQKEFKSHSQAGHQVPVQYHNQGVQNAPPDVQEFFVRRPNSDDINFTSGHSKLFGISIEDAEKMQSTTQSSIYNTRVSPTLPTWRDGDDTTTKKYPSNIYSEVQCRSTRLSLCRGVLPYDLAGTPAQIGNVDITSMMAQIDYLVAANCSDRVRHFVCALLEPECNPPPYPSKKPCYSLCKAVVDSCEGQIPSELIPAFNCKQYARSNCVSAKTPCYPREFACSDGSCIPRDWICDGTKDCALGEDEATCIQCDQNEYRCSSGGCILKRWLCDGYSDCPDGEDEHVDTCGTRSDHAIGGAQEVGNIHNVADTHEPGEESAGSAPAPAIRRPNRVPIGQKSPGQRTGDESSKELLVTSDSNNAFKRKNFTRRPLPPRLSHYHRAPHRGKDENNAMDTTTESILHKVVEKKLAGAASQKTIVENESIEDVNMGDLGFFDEFEKEGREPPQSPRPIESSNQKPAQRVLPVRYGVPPPGSVVAMPVATQTTRLDKSANKLDRVIDGAALLRYHNQGVQNAPPDVQEFFVRRPNSDDINFTSGHSKLFGISIEDAEKMQSTTQSSIYNTRVSPTLPTWRDGDDTTTKKYPSNIYSEVQCRSTRLSLCRGVLPYDLAGTPAQIGNVDITSMMAQIDYLVAANCSDRVRHFVCALLEPECNPPPYPSKKPCYSLCKAVVDSCEGQIPSELIPAFNCKQYARSNCVSAKTPCYPREFACSDGSCIPRDWICDGTKDCALGEDEATCIQCDQNEYRCSSGGCILKRWLCDGYSDCPDGEDEHVDTCGTRSDHAIGGAQEVGNIHNVADTHEPGEESAGSAPAPAIRRPNRVPIGQKSPGQRTGDESSKELLVTSDSNNAFKRKNFTRRPLPPRLSHYHRAPHRGKDENNAMDTTTESILHKVVEKKLAGAASQKTIVENESIEDVNMGDLGFFDEFEKEGREPPQSPRPIESSNQKPAQRVLPVRYGVPPPGSVVAMPVATQTTRLDKSANKLDRVIDGAALLRKAQAEQAADAAEDPGNETFVYVDKDDTPPAPANNRNRNSGANAGGPMAAAVDGEKVALADAAMAPGAAYGKDGPGWSRAHASPCPSGELRCVDGRCITLSQLCDGTIDCSDHADEDNCYT
uniref:FZ domain-containing protein n=1 Tax=Heliothis virescens TaxID=7102 RepID=A0A2A4K0K1_HELVI